MQEATWFFLFVCVCLLWISEVSHKIRCFGLSYKFCNVWTISNLFFVLTIMLLLKNMMPLSLNKEKHNFWGVVGLLKRNHYNLLMVVIRQSLWKHLEKLGKYLQWWHSKESSTLVIYQPSSKPHIIEQAIGIVL